MHNKNNTVQIKGFPLIKFQSYDRIQKLQQGLLYMKNLDYYRELEKTSGDNMVGDLFEGMLHVNEAKLIIPESGEEIIIEDDLIPTSFSDSYAFCMFGINSNIQTFQFTDEQKKEICKFGDTALIITDRDEFFRRIFIAADKEKLKGFHGFVKYYDEKVNSVNLLASLINGMENVAFWKRDTYRYQQEYRFIIQMEEINKDYYELNIGNIEDISKIIKTSSLLNSFATQHS